MQKIVQKMKTRYNIIRKIAMAVCALGMMATGTAWGQITFNHSQGQLKTNAEYNNTTDTYSKYYDYVGTLQQTHEYTKTIYVAPGHSKQLVPYELVTNYYNKYMRWFMYDNEADSTNLKKWTNIESMSEYQVTSSAGYVYAGTTNIGGNADYYPTFDYNGPDDFDGIKIAMEASNAGVSISNSSVTEPTLAYRYILLIKDATALWDEITTSNDTYIAQNRKAVVATAGMFFQVRLSKPLDDYYNGAKYLTKSDVTLEVSRTIDSQDRPLNDIEKNQVYIHDSKDVLIIENPVAGIYTVKIKHKNITIDEYEITFLPLSSAGMLLEDDINKPFADGGFYYHLSQDSLDAVVAEQDGRAFLLGSIDFDEDEEFDYLNHLTNDKSWYPYPILPWTQSSYAWAYTGFDYASYRIVTTSDAASHHSAIDNPKKIVYGHGGTAVGEDAFLYTNVADEPGQMLQLNWDTQICPGSRIYMTFWMNELSNAESANLEVSISGKRATDGAIIPIRTYITGYVPKGLNDKESIHPLYAASQSCRGNWMQVCYSFITDFNQEDYTEFYFTVNNNTKNSGGADFGLDDIRIYATNPTVEARQESQCDERYSVEVLLPFEQIAYIYAGAQSWQDGYFSFWKNEGGKFSPIEYDYNGDGKASKYGHFRYNTQYDNNHKDQASIPAEYPDDMYQVQRNGLDYLGFNTEPTTRNLAPGQTYYIVFYQSAADAQGSTGNPERFSLNTPCLVYSEFQVERSQIALVDGEPTNNEWDACFNQNPTITLEMKTTAEGHNSETYEGSYDVFKGNLTEFDTYQEALSHFRADFPDATDPADVTPLTGENAQFTAEEQKTLTEAEDLFIYNVKSFTAEYPDDPTKPQNQDRTYTIIPIMPEEMPDNETLYCWSPFEFVVHFTKESPYINIGYDDVTYNDYTPSIRVGLDDMNAISGKTLTIPLRDADVVTEENSIAIYKDNAKVFLNTSEVFTNDPQVIEDYSTNVNPFADELIIGSNPIITKDEDGYILTLKLDNNNGKVEFKEGYMYGLRLQYEEIDQNGTATNDCRGDLVFSLKVVPKYQFWRGSATDNWNNDENWVRANAADMNNPSGHSDYTTPYQHNGYVPMYFTKAVIPSENNQVELYSYTKATDTNHEVSIDIPSGSGVSGASTENIEYDLMVKPEGSAYECESYYSNTVSEIHFEPNTEMLHTELLEYKKAWVDYELAKGRWYTLASPLQGVVAGDFYTDKRGKEGQAYFSNINYSTTENDRFNPSVYQRGWKGSATLQTLSAGEKNVAIEGNWSSVYNDVTVPYSEGTGFSLKVQDIADNSSALFRLPKADDEYFYYQKNSTTGSDKKTITRPLNNADKTAYVGRLKTDEKVTLNDLPSLTVTNGTYYLVGNPYMAHINANAFFNTNSGLLKKYWLVDSEGQKIAVGSEISTTGDATNAPLKSFFVTVAEGKEAPESITFNRDMQVLGGTSDNLRSSDVLYLTATTPDGKQSRAVLAYNLAADKDYKASEDAELFLDSNLSDVPTVYTVAGTMATSINQTSELYNIPVGVYSQGAKGENVSLSFSGLNGFSYATLYDAETGTDTPLHEGSSFSIPANTNGRYFLRAGVPTANEAVQENAIRIYSVGGQLVIASTDPLQQVYIYDFAGRLVDSETRLHTTRYTTDLPAGNYMVKARSVSGEKIEKFKLRN